MGREQSHSVLDVVNSLIVEERYEEATELEVDVALLSLIHGVDVETVLDMGFIDYLELYETPEKPTVRVTGRWDKVYYGEAAFRSEEE